MILEPSPAPLPCAPIPTPRNRSEPKVNPETNQVLLIPGPTNSHPNLLHPTSMLLHTQCGESTNGIRLTRAHTCNMHMHADPEHVQHAHAYAYVHAHAHAHAHVTHAHVTVLG